MRSSRRLVLLPLLVALAAPATASATTTVSRSGDVITITGDDGPSKMVTSAYFTQAQIQDDLGGNVVAGAGCTQESGSPTSVDCGAFGPAARVVVRLGGGDDSYKVATPSVPQDVDGGAGNDTIETGEGNDTVTGGPGADDLTGGRGDDTMDGGEGNDKVDGWDGSDTITGGPGRDNLLGDGSTIYAGGNDTLLARDGEADSLDCGGGADRAEVDGTDVVSACAQVDRPAAGSPAPGGGQGTGGAELTVAGEPTTPPKLGKLLAGGTVGIRLQPSATCVSRVALAVTPGEARRLKLGSKAVTLGKSRATTLEAGKVRTVTVALTRAYRRKLRSAKRVSANLVVVCAGASGGTFSGAVAVRLRR